MNYLRFQQAISFGYGVEFLRSSTFSNEPMVYLIKVPALSTNLETSKQLLIGFNEKILAHLEELLDESKTSSIYLSIFTNYIEARPYNGKSIDGQEKNFLQNAEQWNLIIIT